MFAVLKSLPEKCWSSTFDTEEMIYIWTVAEVKLFIDVDLLYIIVKLNLFGTDSGQRQFIRRDFWEGIT